MAWNHNSMIRILERYRGIVRYATRLKSSTALYTTPTHPEITLGVCGEDIGTAVVRHNTNRHQPQKKLAITEIINTIPFLFSLRTIYGNTSGIQN